MKARAWEVWVRDSRTKDPWVKYRTCDRLKDAESTVKRVAGDPLVLKVVPLYPRKDEEMNPTEEYRLKYILAAEGKDRAQREATLLDDDNERLRHALKEACDMRAALCRNSDDDEPPKDPATWDKPLQRWLKALEAPN